MSATSPRAASARGRALRTRAGVVIGLSLLAWLSWPPGAEPSCAAPRAVRALDGTLAGVACGGGDAQTLTGPERLLFGLRVDLNALPADALSVLPRIGEGRARALAAARPFPDLDALESVDGIGPVTAAGVAAWSCVGARGCERPLAADWLESATGMAGGMRR